MSKKNENLILPVQGKSLENITSIMSQVPQITTILEAAIEFSDLPKEVNYKLNVELTIVPTEE